MPGVLFKRAGIVSIISLLLLLRIATWITYGDTRQQRKDAMLINAIKLNHTGQMLGLLSQGANPNAQYTPMTSQEEISAMLQHTWPLRPKHMNLSQPLWKRTLSEWHQKPTDHKKDIPALIVALDVTLDCMSDVRLPPRHRALIQALIEAGADVNAQGSTPPPLLLAITDNRNDIVALLLKHGADLFTKDSRGNTSLMAAAYKGNAELTRSLLERGVNINAVNDYGMTALMLSCYCQKRSKYKTIQILLEHGAEVNAKNKKQETALALAKEYADVKVLALLKKAGAK